MEIDDKIRELFKKLEAKKAELAKQKELVKGSWKTNCVWKNPVSKQPINIQTLGEDLVFVAADILNTFEQAQKAADKYSIEFVPVINGSSLSDWEHDIQKRAVTANIRVTEGELSNIEKRLNQVLSPDERRAIEVELLMKALE